MLQNGQYLYCKGRTVVKRQPGAAIETGFGVAVPRDFVGGRGQAEEGEKGRRKEGGRLGMKW